MRSVLQFALGIALIAIVARTFLVMGLIVPVTVAGSSMSPALNGPHVVADCPQCDAVSPIGADQLPLGNLCPACGAVVPVDGLPIVAGDSIWVDRAAFTIRAPRRWEVVVFQCPNDATQLCVKRVLGLPGERIAFRDGELFVDGQRVSKPVDVGYELRPGDGVAQVGYDARQQCWQVGTGYFVVGDNQAVSFDSRNWPGGPDLPARLIVGRPIGEY